MSQLKSYIYFHIYIFIYIYIYIHGRRPLVYGSMFNVRQESHHIPFVRNLISAWVARQVDNKTKKAPVNTELEACPILLYYISHGGGACMSIAMWSVIID
jgi:hypothetical protein